MARAEKLLGEVEADDGMPAAVSVDDEDPLLVGGSSGSFDGEDGSGGSRREASRGTMKGELSDGRGGKGDEGERAVSERR